MDRRSVLRMAGAAGVTGVIAGASGLPPAGAADSDGTLVVVFLRGGMDGLSVIVPADDPQLLAARPNLAVRAGALRPLDRGFGLHPALGALHGFWGKGQLAAVHAVSTPDISRSHFQAQDCLERGGSARGASEGWLDRVLDRMPPGSTFRAVGQGWGMPRSLLGNQPSMSLDRLERLRFNEWEGVHDQAMLTVAALHAGLTEQRTDVDKALEAVKAAERITGPTDPAADKPLPGYADDDFSQGLAQLARLIKSNLGMRVACIELSGWDTHEGQGGPENGRLHERLGVLGMALGTFATDLGDRLEKVTVVVMTEFGRCVQENGSGGTDHGHGAAVLLLGGGLRGGQVHGNWQGIAPEVRDHGDVPGLNDYRNVLGDVVCGRLNLTPADMTHVFPNHRFQPLGLMR